MENAIERRKPVWSALSEFYLDTELQADDYDRIAAACRASGFTLHELKAIDRYELFPLLQLNLLSGVGEWAGFDEAWLHSRCERFYRWRKNPLQRFFCVLFNLLFYWMRRSHWKQIEKRLRKTNLEQAINEF